MYWITNDIYFKDSLIENRKIAVINFFDRLISEAMVRNIEPDFIDDFDNPGKLCLVKIEVIASEDKFPEDLTKVTNKLDELKVSLLKDMCDKIEPDKETKVWSIADGIPRPL